MSVIFSLGGPNYLVTLESFKGTTHAFQSAAEEVLGVKCTLHPRALSADKVSEMNNWQVYTAEQSNHSIAAMKNQRRTTKTPKNLDAWTWKEWMGARHVDVQIVSADNRVVGQVEFSRKDAARGVQFTAPERAAEIAVRASNKQPQSTLTYKHG